MALTYEPIQSTTLTSAQANITFSSISGNYTDLVVVMTGGHPSVSTRIRFNSDTGSNYSYTGIYGDGSSAGSARASNATSGYLGSITTGVIFNTIIHIQNYANTTTNKTAINRKNQTNSYVEANVILWRSTAAINSITLFADSGNLESGTTATLYGIKAA